MIRLIVVVEGKTEREFVKDVLAPHLSDFGVIANARVIGKPGQKGGNVSVDRIASDVRNVVGDADAVTTLVDFYGFRRRPTDDVGELQQEIDRACQRAANRELRDDRYFAYVQLHEFETLLFSAPRAFKALGIASEESVQRLETARSEFPTPEDINDSRETAPSKRILQAVPTYSKSEYGPLIAAGIGLQAMREQCPRFAEWLSRLERLAGGIP